MSKKILLSIVVMGLAFALVAVYSQKTEAFKGTIKVADITDWSGPAAKSGKAISDGIHDYVRTLNEEKGGIAGYKLEVESYDTKFDPNLMLAAYKRYADELETKFIYSPIAAITPAPMKIADTKKCVLMCMSGHPKYVILSTKDESAGKENYFFIHTPSVHARMASAVEWIKNEWTAKGKKGVPRIAGFNMDNESGHMSTTAAHIYSEKAGFKWMGGTYHARSITDAVSQVALLKRWKVDYVLGAADLDQPLTVFVKELQRMKFDPIVMHHTTLGTAYLETGHEAFEGDMCYQYTLAWPDKQNPVIAKIHAVNKKWHPKVEFRVPLYVAGWHGAVIFCEALRRAVETYGAENLTGLNIKKSFETLKDFDMGGLSAPITYNSWDHQGNHSLRWVKFEKGKLIPIGPFITSPPLTDEERDYRYWLKD